MLIREGSKRLMHQFSRTLTSAILTLLVLCSTASAETRPGVVRGDVIDASGGVLPGVTVVATATDGRVLATEVTDAAGGFVFAALPPGAVHLTFQLEGFAPTVVRLTVQSAESRPRALGAGVTHGVGGRLRQDPG
jgi:hypothetical protein